MYINEQECFSSVWKDYILGTFTGASDTDAAFTELFRRFTAFYAQQARFLFKAM